MKYKYRDYQKEGANFLVREKKAYCCIEQGLGKTAVAIAAAQLFKPILVICPSIATGVWTSEFDLWLHDNIKEDFKVQVIKKGKDELNTSAKAIIISFALATKKVRELMRFGFGVIIVDEAHYCKEKDTARTKAVMALVRHTDRAYCLTGTPMPNRPSELWPMMRAMGITDMTFLEYAKKFCKAYQPVYMQITLKNGKVHKGWDTSGASRLPQLKELLAPKMFRRTKEQVGFELPAKTYQIISLGLPVDKREKAYDLASLEKTPDKVAFVGLSEILHMQGLVKIPKVVEYVKEQINLGNVKKLILFCNHRDVAADYQEKLRKYGVVKIIGGMSSKARDKAISDFQTNPDIRVIVLNIKAACTAITLTEANMVLFAENSWVAGDIEQASDRAHRIGQKNNVLVQFLTVEGSIDEFMLRSALKKMKTIRKVI